MVSETLDMPHPLIAATERAFRRLKRRHPDHVTKTEAQSLDLSVSDGSVPRALRIMDALAKALDARAMPLRIIESEGKRRSCVTLQGQDLAIRIVENVVRTERELTEKERREKEKYGHV